MDRKTFHGYASRYGVGVMQMEPTPGPGGILRQGERRYFRADVEILAEQLRTGDLDGRIVNHKWVPNSDGGN